MNKTRLATYWSVGLFLIGGCMAGEKLFNKEEREAVQKLLNEYNEIGLSDSGGVRLVPEAEWPRHVAPIVFNESWKTPSEVWRIHGGHLIAYESGEWGGAIFFLPLDNRDLLLLAKVTVNSIAKVADGSYIAAGGTLNGGTVTRLWIGRELKWHSKVVMTTWAGIFTVLGLRNDAAVIAIIQSEKNILGGSFTEKISLFGLYTVNAHGEIEVRDLPTKK